MEPLEKLDEVFELDSDQECDLRPIDSDDSDEEFSLDLMQRLRRFGTQLPSTKRQPEKKVVEDDFEREVNAELAASLAAHCRRIAPGVVCDRALPQPPGTGQLPPATSDTARPPAAAAADAGKEAEQEKKQEQEYYDDIYFDSDDDSGPEDGAAGAAADSAAADSIAADSNTAGADTAAMAGGSSSGAPPSADPGSRRSARRRRRRPVLTNDQLLYDPAMDEQDQQWVDRQRQRYLPAFQASSGNLQSKPQKLPHSDAVLNCPACMTMLCLDCQRHELYSNQYRAMFVFNCDVDASQGLRYRLKEPPRRGRGRRGGGGDQPPAAAAQELYNPVKCNTCKTEVAVCDGDEVYHFFNVIASHS